MPKPKTKKKGSQKKARSPRKPKTKALEPLKGPAGNVAELSDILDWLGSLCDFPIEEQNSAIRANREALAPVLEEMVFDSARLLHRPLAAENSGDRESGEQTFLTVLRPIRDRLIREYGISTAAEFLVIDALVLSYYQYMRAATLLHQYTAYDKSFNYETLVRYAQPYLAKANDLFLRNLQALREMKTSPITIKIEQAGQVNVGDQQLNVSAQSASCPGKEAEDVRTAERFALTHDNEDGKFAREGREVASRWQDSKPVT